MKQRYRNLSCLLIPFALIGCDKDNPSTKYPEQIIFQNIDMIVSADHINATSSYYSNDVVYFSSPNEKQYLTINDDQRFELNIKRTAVNEYDYDYSTQISAEQLTKPIKSDDLLKVTFNRSSGSVLESTATVPQFIEFISPQADQVINNSNTDFDIQWDLPAKANSALYLQGECLDHQYVVDNTEIPGLRYDLTEGQTQLSFLANMMPIQEWFEGEQCEISANLYHKSQGSVDNNFAGGHFTVMSHSSVSFTLTNLKDTGNE